MPDKQKINNSRKSQKHYILAHMLLLAIRYCINLNIIMLLLVVITIIVLSKCIYTSIRHNTLFRLDNDTFYWYMIPLDQGFLSINFLFL